jgi:Tfp pilus assembly protein PilE
MAPQRHNFRRGFTLVELIITTVAAVIFILGITGILASGIKNYRTMYNRVTSDVVRNAYEAKIIFDRIVRQSTIKRYDPSNADITPSSELYVYYYSDPNNLNIVEPDRYARFYLNDADNSQLMLEQGNVTGNFGAIPPSLPSLSATSTYLIAENVYSVTFKVFMYSVEMSLILDNEIIPENTNKLETMRMTVTSTAILHNDWYDSED